MKWLNIALIGKGEVFSGLSPGNLKHLKYWIWTCETILIIITVSTWKKEKIFCNSDFPITEEQT
jgi:hypothetical protein